MLVLCYACEGKGTVGSWTRGSLKWSYEDCEPHARIGYEANLIDPQCGLGPAYLHGEWNSDGLPRSARDHPAALNRRSCGGAPRSMKAVIWRRSLTACCQAEGCEEAGC